MKKGSIISILLLFLSELILSIGITYLLVNLFELNLNTTIHYVQCFVLILMVIFILKLWKIDVKKYLKKLKTKRVLLICLLGVLIYMFSPILRIVEFVNSLSEGSMSIYNFINPLSKSVNDTSFFNIYTIVYTVLLAPILEEIFYRVIIQNHLRKHYSLVFSILLTSMLFGLRHFYLNLVIVTFFWSIILGLLYEKNKNLTEVILLHAIMNLCSLFFIQKNVEISGFNLMIYVPVLFLILYLLRVLIKKTSAKASKFIK